MLLVLAAGTCCGSQPSSAPPVTAQSLLRRPFTLPARLGSPCQVSSAQEAASFSPFGRLQAIGRGPIYAVMSSSPHAMEVSHGTAKVMWISAPSYQGDVVVRGASLPDEIPLIFSTGQHLELRTDNALDQLGQPYRSTTPSWRAWPTTVDLPRSGCYGFQVDTAVGSTVMIFSVQ